MRNHKFILGTFQLNHTIVVDVDGDPTNRWNILLTADAQRARNVMQEISSCRDNGALQRALIGAGTAHHVIWKLL